MFLLLKVSAFSVFLSKCPPVPKGQKKYCTILFSKSLSYLGLVSTLN